MQLSQHGPQRSLQHFSDPLSCLWCGVTLHSYGSDALHCFQCVHAFSAKRAVSLFSLRQASLPPDKCMDLCAGSPWLQDWVWESACAQTTLRWQVSRGMTAVVTSLQSFAVALNSVLQQRATHGLVVPVLAARGAAE